MSAWRTMLAGLVVWLIHFGIVYLAPSLEAIGAAAPPVLAVAHGVATLTCLAAAIVLALVAWKKGRTEEPGAAFRHHIAALGAAIAGVAIVRQSAPAWLN